MKEKVLSILIAITCAGCSMNKAFISYGTSEIRINSHLTIENFIFDTGATYSAIFDLNTINADTLRTSPETIYDISRTPKIQNVYKPETFKIGKLNVQNISFVHITQTDLSPYMEKYKGIIGMNVINRANWFFDLNNRKVTVLPKDSIVYMPVNTLKFNYNQTNLHPETSIKIEDILFRKVRIDSGHFHTLDLDTDDIYKLNESYSQKYHSSDSVSSVSLFNERITKPSHTYHNILINDKFVIDNFTINENQNNRDSRRLGFGFIKKFNYFFMDTKKRQIYLW